MAIRLWGHFSYVDKFNKLVFVFGEEPETQEKLIRLCKIAVGDMDAGVMNVKGNNVKGNNTRGNNVKGSDMDMQLADVAEMWPEDNPIVEAVRYHYPFSNKEFTVTLPKNMKKPTPDIVRKVGFGCTVHVKLVKYDFCSKLDANKGDRIVGVNLILSDIKQSCE
jgi:hypothetical protein